MDELKVTFSPGQVVATPAALATFRTAGESVIPYLQRHVRMDWGDVNTHDTNANTAALHDGSRLWSVYHLKDGTKVWIITEAIGDDGTRESTCILLPEDY